MGDVGQDAASCGRHPQAPATHYCSACNENRCAECAKRTWFQGGFVNQCGECGGLLQEVGSLRKQTPGRALPQPGAASFVERLPDMLLFPFQRNVLIMLMGLALITAPLQYASQYAIGILGIVGMFLVLGMQLMIMFHFIVSTAHGAHVVEAPGVEDPWEDLIAPVFLFMTASLPIVIAGIWWGESNFGSWFVGMVMLAIDPTVLIGPDGPGVLFIAGVALLPLLTAIAALSRSYLSILNPVLWVESLRIMWATYPIAAVSYYAIGAFEVFVYADVLREIYATVEIPGVTRYAITVLAYLPMAIRARIIGAMCEPYLGDFE